MRSASTLVHMRVMFAGTPAVAVPALEAVFESSHELVGVLTRPPAPVGRKRILTPSPVHQRAQELGVSVHTGPVNSPELQELLEGIDCVAVVAYGALIREPSLSLPHHGWINLHFSLLPRWRGAAPVQHAIMAGDTVSGVSVFQIEAGLDTGPVYTTVSEDITADDTAADLLGRLSAIGAPALVDTLDAIERGEGRPRPQQGEVTLAPTLHSADAQVPWTRSATAVANTIRGLTPAPGAWTRTDAGRFKIGPVAADPGEQLPPGRVRVTGDAVRVGTGTHPVTLGRIAPPGKQWMDARDWARGLRGPDITFGTE